MSRWGQIFILNNGSGGGGGGDTNLGNTNLQADGTRSYDTDANTLTFLNGATHVWKISGSTLQIGTSGNEYSMPTTKAGTNGFVPIAAGVGGSAVSWGAMQNLGNTDLTADANREYDVDGNTLEFVNGATDVMKINGSSLQIGTSGSEYTMPNARAGANGRMIASAGTAGDAPVWNTVEQELFIPLTGVVSGGMAARESVAGTIGSGGAINLGAVAMPSITNIVGGRGIFFPDADGDYDGIEFCINATFEGTITSGAAVKPFFAKASTSSGVTSHTFTITKGATATSLTSTTTGTNVVITGSITLTAGAGIYMFGITNNSAVAAVCTGNISLSGWVRFKKSLVLS